MGQHGHGGVLSPGESVGQCSSGSPGSLDGFDPASKYVWTIATASAAIAGFDASDFELRTDRFENLPKQGHFEIGLSADGASVELSYVPEPTCLAVLALGAAGIVLRRRGKRGHSTFSGSFRLGADGREARDAGPAC